MNQLPKIVSEKKKKEKEKNYSRAQFSSKYFSRNLVSSNVDQNDDDNVQNDDHDMCVSHHPTNAFSHVIISHVTHAQAHAHIKNKERESEM